MLAVTLTLSSIISILFLIVGGVVGYLLKEYVYERNSTYIPTPKYVPNTDSSTATPIRLV